MMEQFSCFALQFYYLLVPVLERALLLTLQIYTMIHLIFLQYFWKMNIAQLPQEPQTPFAGAQERTKSPVNETSEPFARETFACECGKKYLSFPALYVHARIKHNLKLSCKHKKETFSTEMAEGELKKTFSLKNGKQNKFEEIEHPQAKQLNLPRNSSQGQMGFRNQIIIEEVLLLFHKQNPNSPQKDVRILKNFGEVLPKYLCKNQSLKISDLPNYFNQFLVSHLPECSEVGQAAQKWRESCHLMYSFYEWLFAKSFTKLILIPEFM